ncbi:MAG: hypothetical protein PVF89_04155, partial [Lysobacterales bacterium]
MGVKFDLREFHDRILENGTIPLQQPRTPVEEWTAAFRARASSLESCAGLPPAAGHCRTFGPVRGLYDC